MSWRAATLKSAISQSLMQSHQISKVSGDTSTRLNSAIAPTTLTNSIRSLSRIFSPADKFLHGGDSLSTSRFVARLWTLPQLHKKFRRPEEGRGHLHKFGVQFACGFEVAAVSICSLDELLDRVSLRDSSVPRLQSTSPIMGPC